MVARHCPSNSWWESLSECWWCHEPAPIHVTLLTPAPSVIRSRNEEWIIVFCRHTNVTQLLLQVTGLHVLMFMFTSRPLSGNSSLLSVQVSLKRCLFRMMTGWQGWWHGAGQWSAATGRRCTMGVQRDTQVRSSAGNTSVTCSHCLSGGQQGLAQAREIRYKPGLPLLPRPSDTNIPQMLPWKNRI